MLDKEKREVLEYEAYIKSLRESFKTLCEEIEQRDAELEEECKREGYGHTPHMSQEDM